MSGDNRRNDYPAEDERYDNEVARKLADRVMKVQSKWDRVGGLYEMAYRGALAGLNYQYQVNS